MNLLRSRELALVCSCFAFFATHSYGALIVYEGFNYGVAGANRAGSDLLQGQADGVGGDVASLGLSGTWTDSSGPGANSDLFLQSGSLGFGDLPTSGNSVRSDTNLNNDVFSRPITSSLASTSTGELWFSFTANKLQNNFSAAEGGIVIGSQPVTNARILENIGLTGFGVAPTTNGNNWTAYGWDGSGIVTGSAALTVAVDGSETNLLVGQIDYNSGTAGADVFNLFSYALNAGSIVGGSLVPITSIEVNADESQLNTLSLTRQVNTHYDEIRIGESLPDVLAVPEPSLACLMSLSLFGLLLRRR